MTGKFVSLKFHLEYTLVHAEHSEILGQLLFMTSINVY